MTVVVDGAVDLPDGAPEAEGIVTVPSEVWKDGERWQGSLDEFWAALRSDPEGWATAPPTVNALLDAYAAPGQIWGVHVSRELSTTVTRAKEAASRAGSRVHVIDSRSLSVGAGLVGLGVATAALDVADTADEATRLIRDLHTYVLADDVDYLRRSGRFGLLAGTPLKSRHHYLLAVKGHSVPMGQSRSRDKAIASMLDHASDTAPPGDLVWAAGHADASDIDDVVDRGTHHLGRPPAFVVPVDATVGSHVGPDALVVAITSAIGRRR